MPRQAIIDVRQAAAKRIGKLRQIASFTRLSSVPAPHLLDDMIRLSIEKSLRQPVFPVTLGS